MSLYTYGLAATPAPQTPAPPAVPPTPNTQFELAVSEAAHPLGCADPNCEPHRCAARKRLVEEVCASYLHDKAQAAQLVAQIEHRLNLAEAWGLARHEAVLDIGCGQGESALAFAVWVGHHGSVIGIDPGAPDYGSPITLGQSWEYIRRSPLGERTTFQHHDLRGFLERFYSFGGTPFHTATLCHSLWYFPTRQAISHTFGLLGQRGIVKRVMVAEYTGEARTPEQLPHEYAYRAQVALYRARRAQRELEQEEALCNGATPGGHDTDRPGDDAIDLANIREALLPRDIVQIATAAGWLVSKQGILPTPDGMRDGSWEVAHVLSPEFLEAVLSLSNFSATTKLLNLVEQIREMRDAMAAQGQHVHTMDAAWIVFSPGENAAQGVRDRYYHEGDATRESDHTDPLPVEVGFEPIDPVSGRGRHVSPDNVGQP